MTTVIDHITDTGNAALERIERRMTPKAALVAVFVLNAEIAFLATYVLVGDNAVYDWVPLLAPFVWINVSILAVAWTRIGPTSTRQRAVALAIAAGYFLVLGYFGGLFGPGVPARPTSVSLNVAGLPPGWAPALLANVPPIRLSMLFYKVVGYLALAYLVYATVIDAAGSAIGGIVGLLSCVSCSWPILGSIVTGVFGSSSAIAVATQSWPYALSTGIFVATVGLLYWRPGIGRLGSDDAG